MPSSHQSQTGWGATGEINLATTKAATCCRWKASFQHLGPPICQRQPDMPQIPDSSLTPENYDQTIASLNYSATATEMFREIWFTFFFLNNLRL